MAPTASHVALLAPVPLEHLEDGRSTCDTQGKVAFGSRAWEVFRALDQERKGMPVDVYIYASRAEDRRAVASWHAHYIDHVESINGAHPSGMLYRPPSTARYADDNEGHWAIFWEVTALRRLQEAHLLALTGFTGFGKARPYPRDFVPEGPMLIEHP